MRSNDEQVLLFRRMAEQLDNHRHPEAAARVREKISEMQEQGNRIREILVQREQNEEPEKASGRP